MLNINVFVLLLVYLICQLTNLYGKRQIDILIETNYHDKYFQYTPIEYVLAKLWDICVCLLLEYSSTYILTYVHVLCCCIVKKYQWVILFHFLWNSCILPFSHAKMHVENNNLQRHFLHVENVFTCYSAQRSKTRNHHIVRKRPISHKIWSHSLWHGRT